VCTAITKLLARPGGVRLLVVTATMVRFTRKDGDVWALRLPSSIPGRPSSMLRVEDLMDAAAATEGPLVFCLDATLAAGTVADRHGSAAAIAEQRAQMASIVKSIGFKPAH